ncbi:serine hydrolase domain-containing protein [Pontibacter akesuensis]|uniref:CubicO group peptidase, beta-lactamase class C family n=1 Tax=Pontibacter akesuensis TaxID=388950 RepID=A0A1I7IF13_9BACT|nr:serine hydrolase domain-containing protein [Pontibacter akesuensis]SFU71488.1 CubicO group peptidase, beta-lactamase class C family [Pontibacter akesuensis]
MKKVILLLSPLLLLLACKSTEQIVPNGAATHASIKPKQRSSFDDSWMRSKIDSALKANNIPALSVGVISDGELWLYDGFGLKKREGEAAADEHTLYQIGSQTKMLTGIIVNRLVLERKLDLDASIVTYLPGVFNNQTREKLHAVTLRNLLQHKAGLPGIAPSDHRIDGDPMLVPYTELDLLKDLDELELAFAPGTDFSYSNMGYALVGYICERVSGQKYETLLQEYVAKPYQLTNTTTELAVHQQELLATPYRKDARNIETKPFIMGKLTSAGGVYSSVADLSRLMAAQLEAYRMLGQTEEQSPLVLTDSATPDKKEYGFGLVRNVDERGVRYGHGGDLDGFASSYVFVPEHNVGLLLLTSSGGRWFGALEKELVIKLVAEAKQAKNKSVTTR